MASGEIPKLTWGAGFANTWEFGYPLDNAIPREVEREGSSHTQAPSGTRDGWSLGTDKRLRGELRHVPAADGTTPEGNPITGIDGSTGVRAAIAWLLTNTGRFYPDRDVGSFVEVDLIEPHNFDPQLESTTGKVRFFIEIESVDESRFTGYVA